MARLRKCPSCGNDDAGQSVFRCLDCSDVFCGACATESDRDPHGLPLHRCPHCGEDATLQPHGSIGAVKPGCKTCSGSGTYPCPDHCVDCGGVGSSQCQQCDGSGAVACRKCDVRENMIIALSEVALAVAERGIWSDGVRGNGDHRLEGAGRDWRSTGERGELLRRATAAALLLEDGAIWEAVAKRVRPAPPLCAACGGSGDHSCPGCKGEGDVGCESCGGKYDSCEDGVMVCEDCDGKGYWEGE